MAKKDYSARIQERWNSKKEREERRRRQQMEEFEQQCKVFSKLRSGPNIISEILNLAKKGEKDDKSIS